MIKEVILLRKIITLYRRYSMLNIYTLSSGSKGNATYIQSNKSGLLIDCGLSRKTLLERMDAMEIDASCVTAVILTHEHTDHLKGIRLACDYFCAPLYLTAQTHRCLRDKKDLLPSIKEIRTFEAGSTLQIGDLSIRTFSTSHDAIDPIALRIENEGEAVGFATDLGKINPVAQRHLSGCDYLFVEANYDENLLRNSSRPEYLKRRILGERGHLCNDDTLNALESLVGEKTRFLTLGHLSDECNSHELVNELFAKKLIDLKRKEITLNTARADRPMSLISLKGALACRHI